LNDYYVYVYIDPRNYEEFYYGKGTGSRKDAHLADTSDSEKANRIREIQEEGLVPIIRVIARGLSQGEALLVEKTLLWKLGKFTTNVATGSFADKFRPFNTMHRELSGFDFRNGFYYYNVCEGPHRNWDDYRRFGFISAGQGVRWRDAMCGYNKDDVVAAYFNPSSSTRKIRGFVGIGRILAPAQRIRDVRINGRPLLDLPLICQNMSDNSEDAERSEYVCPVEWLASVPREEAKWRSAPKLYTSTHVRASLDGQLETVKFLESEFALKIRDLIF